VSFANKRKRHKGITIKRLTKYETELKQKEAPQAMCAHRQKDNKQLSL
jgi:hypothetical protein